MNDTDYKDPLLGRALDGRYRLERRLGKGGMGSVYVARQQAIDRSVAVKVLRQDLAEDPGMVQRFIDEARAASRILHPNIVTIYDFGRSEDGHLYMAMELIDGESLKSVLARDGPLGRDRALHIAGQICDGLAAAHAGGVVHRDLKPENFMLAHVGDETDFVKILDFGVAKFAQASASAAKTSSGVLMGTPLYMAPEYIRGLPSDHRVDLYAVGVVLYEMLSGRSPFDADNPTAVMLAQLQKPLPPITSVREDLGDDAALCDLLDRALAKLPEARFQTAAEMRAALRAVREAAPSATLGAGRTRASIALPPAPTTALPAPVVPSGTAGSRTTARRLRPVFVGGAALLLLGAAALALALRGSHEPEGLPPGPVPVAPAPSAPAPVPAALPAPAAPPEPPPLRAPARAQTVTLRLRSVPARATVVRGREAIATTPDDIEVPRGSEIVVLRFRKRGYADRVVEVIPEQSQTVMARLSPRRPAREEASKGIEPPGPPSAPPALQAVPPEPPKPRRKIYGMEFEN